MNPETKIAIALALLLVLNLLAPFACSLYVMRCVHAQRREARAMLCALAQALGFQLVPVSAASGSPAPSPLPPPLPLPGWSPPPAVKVPKLARDELGSAVMWQPRPGALPPGHPHCLRCQAPSPFHEPACAAKGSG